jgi:hypothetical protein
MMSAEAASAQKDADPVRQEAAGASAEAALDPGAAGAGVAGWLGHELLSHPANAGVRALAMRRAQQTHGNRYVQRMVSQAGTGHPSSPFVERQCACGGSCAACKEAEAGKATGIDLFPLGGEPIQPEIRRLMESRFGTDVGGVRVHTDFQAAASTQSLNAAAYTSGRDIYFGQGQ